MTTDSLEVFASLLETTMNTRDLGRYRSTDTGEVLKEWRILRSDVQNYPSERDIALLKSKKILTIIDMREEESVRKKPSGFLGREGFFYHNFPIEEGSGIPESVDRVSESYMSIAESKNIVRVFRTIADASTGVMFNCSAGKDRTGVVSAILLGLCGVSEKDIVSDYMLTKTLNRKRFELIRQKYPEIDMNIVIPNERYMAEFLFRLKDKYGSFREYLKSIGLTEEETDRISAKLL